jgi:hypothetical protein
MTRKALGRENGSDFRFEKIVLLGLRSSNKAE